MQVRDAVDVVETRWCARMSVHLKVNLLLSDRDMDYLMHLLSFEFNTGTNWYDHLVLAQNPNKSSDQAAYPRLKPRTHWKVTLAQIFGEAEAEAIADGSIVSRAWESAVAEMYAQDSKAALMRADPSVWRPWHPTLQGQCRFLLLHCNVQLQCKLKASSTHPLLCTCRRGEGWRRLFFLAVTLCCCSHR